MNLPLFQLCDSALPIGGYTHSWGLEAAQARGVVRGPESLERWVSDWLRHALGPLEGVLVAGVCRATAAGDWTTVSLANERLAVSVAPPSLRDASRAMGEQLLSLARTWPWSQEGAVELHRCCPGAYHAIVFGVLSALARCTPEDAVAAYLHQSALGMIGAGVRAVPIGHTHGQQVLAYLHDDISSLARELAGRSLETAGATCPLYEVLCDEQTRLYARMFRS